MIEAAPSSEPASEFRATTHPSDPNILVINRNAKLVALLPPGSVARLVGVGGSEEISNLGETPVDQARWLHYRTPEVRLINEEKAGEVMLDLLSLTYEGPVIDLTQAVFGKNIYGEELDFRARVGKVACAFAPPILGAIKLGYSIKSWLQYSEIPPAKPN